MFILPINLISLGVFDRLQHPQIALVRLLSNHSSVKESDCLNFILLADFWKHLKKDAEKWHCYCKTVT